MKTELIIQGMFMLGAVMLAGFHNWSQGAEVVVEKTTYAQSLTETQGDLPTISAIKAYEARNKFRRTASFSGIGQIEGVNLSNSLIKSLSKNMNEEYDGFRVYYGEMDGEQIGILYPLTSGGAEMADLPSYSYAQLKEKVYLTPCPPLCD